MRLQWRVPSVLVVFLCVSVVAPLFAASSSGTLTVNGTEFIISDGHATTRPDPWDDSKTTVFLVFTDQKLPAGALFDEWALTSLADEGISGLTVQIDDEKDAIGGSLFSPAFHEIHQFSTSGNQKIEITTWSADRVAGSVSVQGDDFFDETYAYSVRFDLPIETAPAGGPAGEILTGEPLPADGGEVGVAYENYRKAMAAGDLDGIRRSVISEMAEQTRSEDFLEILPMIQSMQPAAIRITGGSVDGNSATLLVESLDEENTTATVTMQREDGQWKLVNEAWKVSH
jgi:hypothetical protein